MPSLPMTARGVYVRASTIVAAPSSTDPTRSRPSASIRVHAFLLSPTSDTRLPDP
jgi:hypothetical protein